MKNKIWFLVAILFSFCVMSKVSAASMSLKSNYTTVSVGSSVSVTVSASGVAGSFNVSSSNSGVLSGGGSVFLDNSSQSYTFTAKSVGTATITARAVDASDYNAKTFSGSKSITIKVISKSSSSSNSSKSSSNNSSSSSMTKTEDTKSSDNTLKSLSIDNYNISPDFDKNKTEYSVSTPNGVEKIKINADVTDSKATISGTGEKTVNEGDNKFDIVVTAENGDKKTYTLTVTVDTKPITVTMGKKDYTLIKKKEELPSLSIEHEDLTLSIEEEDIPAYRIDKLNYVLVGLKDTDGNIKLYKFNSFKDSSIPFEYKPFILLSSNKLNIVYLKFPSKLIPENYKKYTQKISGEEITVYKLSKNSKYSLFYGINAKTGKKNIYRYDSKEKTFQIYEREEAEKIEKQIDELSLILVGLIGLSSLLLLIIIILVAKKKRKPKKVIKGSL